MDYLWNLAVLSQQECQAAEVLQKECNLLPITAHLFVQRGIYTPEKLRRFLKPSLKDLHDPFLMTDMRKAVDRLNKALGHKEKILVYGDYDVDGTTAVTLMYKVLRKLTTKVDYYIPERYAEGSGISFQGIDYAHETGCTLIIALDCGIKAVEKVKYAKDKGIDFIICDHHVPGEELPEAVAILNAKCPRSSYPFDELSGCGVGFKFAQAFTIDNGGDMRNVYDFLDLVAISIGADLVKLTDENRILATYGLKQINKNPRLGIKSIIDVCDIRSRQIGMNEVVFKIGPRINASGRMQNGKESVELLLANTMQEARKLTKKIDGYNSQRRELDKIVTEEAITKVKGFKDKEKHRLIAVYDPTWHKGVIGIVASRLTEQFNRPSMVMTDAGGDDLVCGSARSIAGFDIYNIVEQCKDLLLNFGGHTYATGFTLKRENVDKFITRVQELGSSFVSEEIITPQINIDLEIELSDITPQLRKELREMAPHGPGNEKPVFCTREVTFGSNLKFPGRNKNHVKGRVSEDTSGETFNFFAYNKAVQVKELERGQKVDIVYTIEEYSRMGKNYVQLLLLDVRS